MGSVIHARKRPDGTFVYRIWSTISDRYQTDDMDSDELVLQLRFNISYEMMQEYERRVAAIPRNIERAQHQGSSSQNDTPVQLDSKWATERCEQCERFHHEFIDHYYKGPANRGNACRYCGEQRDDKAHDPPCKDKS